MNTPEFGFFEFHDQPALILQPDALVVRANHAFEKHFGPWQAGQILDNGLGQEGLTALKELLRSLQDAPASFIHHFAPANLPARRWSWQLWLQDGLVYGRARPAGQLPEGSLMFSALFNSSAIGIGILDKHGMLVDVNEAFLDMLGYARADLLQTKGLDLVHRPDRKEVKELDEQLQAQKLPRYQVKIRLKKRNNRMIWVVMTVNAISGLSGEKLFLSTVENIDQQVKADQKLMRRAEELSRSNKELEQFAYVASHDLQQPLRTVSNFLQLLQRKYSNSLDDDAVEFIRHGVEGAQRMQHMIRDLLAYSRVQRLDEELQFIDFNEVMEEVNTNLQDTAETNAANVLSEYLPALRASRRQMVQLFQNLIENAIKFGSSERRPEVIVSAAELNNKIRFSVSDNGIGIEPENREKIFSLFHRLNERTDVEGTGIGLAVCQKIVENHGGRIWVESQPGKGSTFYFTVKKG